MHNSNDFPYNGPTLFDEIGGEPLAGSGFETENRDLEFAQGELSQMEQSAPVEK